VVRYQGPGFMVLWGVPFVLGGLHFIFGRFLVDYCARSRTFYGVTDKRAIIVSGLVSRNVKSLSVRTITDLALSERSDGSGSITFGPSLPWGFMYSGLRWPGIASSFPHRKVGALTHRPRAEFTNARGQGPSSLLRGRR